MAPKKVATEHAKRKAPAAARLRACRAARDAFLKAHPLYAAAAQAHARALETRADADIARAAELADMSRTDASLCTDEACESCRARREGRIRGGFDGKPLGVGLPPRGAGRGSTRAAAVRELLARATETIALVARLRERAHSMTIAATDLLCGVERAGLQRRKPSAAEKSALADAVDAAERGRALNAERLAVAALVACGWKRGEAWNAVALDRYRGRKHT
ncbi:MAG: hypothetical protein IT373_20815 [Polyangiaceae bacterium]|nr:hypothetical protein [Polyangiaceae bacterium]